jgi:hypothetical protein
MVIVAHAGIGIDRPGGLVQGILRNGHGHQAAPVSQASRVENGADLPDQTVLLHPLDSSENFLFPDPHPTSQGLKGAGFQGERPLDLIQQLSIDGIQDLISPHLQAYTAFDLL